MENIDILMATYNGEKYVKEQIESILNQTYKNFRLLISDDCSNDNTKLILQEICKKDNRIEVFYQPQNIGVVRNFEFLLSKVQNEFFMFSDQDDYWNQDKIELSINKLEQENSDLVYTDLEVVDDNLKQISRSYWKSKGLNKKIRKYNNFEAIYLNNFVTGCTILCKSSWIKNILPIPKNSKYILHDYWTAIIVSLNGKISYLDTQTIKYRQHTNNSVGTKNVSETMNSLDEIRELFIEVKLDHFNTFLENKERFTDDINKKSKDSLLYFEKLKEKRSINLKDLILFFRLYKYENMIYVIKNCIILNFTSLGKILYKFIKK